jgi:hypothetical protein
MAMPSSYPPPPFLDDEAQPPGWTDADIFSAPSTAVRLLEPAPLRLADRVLALAEQMADSVHCGIGDVLRRTKSRNWMLGRLRREIAGKHSDEEIRDAILALSRAHRPTISDELGPRPVELTSRRPPKFLEPSAWPAWGPRVEQLGTLVVFPMTIAELTRRAEIRLGWRDENYVKQATAAAEDANEIWYDRAFQHWHRTAERILMMDPKKKTKTVRVQRHLSVTLKAEDRAVLTDRLQAVDDEREALSAELEEFKRVQRAKLTAAEERRERVIDAMKTGRETQLVECEERWAYEQREVVTVRKDTGEVVERREMTTEELQLRMPEAS